MASFAQHAVTEDDQEMVRLITTATTTTNPLEQMLRAHEEAVDMICDEPTTISPELKQVEICVLWQLLFEMNKPGSYFTNIGTSSILNRVLGLKSTLDLLFDANRDVQGTWEVRLETAMLRLGIALCRQLCGNLTIKILQTGGTGLFGQID